MAKIMHNIASENTTFGHLFFFFLARISENAEMKQTQKHSAEKTVFLSCFLPMESEAKLATFMAPI